MKRGCLGCSFPIIIAIAIILLGLAVLGFLAGPIGPKIVQALFPGISLPEWLSALNVPRPDPRLPAEVVFHIFGFPITNSIIGAWITIVVLVGFSYIVTRRMRLVPGRLQAAFEFLLGWLYNLCNSVAGDRNGRRFFPIVATIFLFVAFNAWLSLIPGFGSIIINEQGEAVGLLRGANTDVNTPLAIALFSFVFVELYGFRSAGLGYVTKFVNVVPLFKALGLLFRGKVKPKGFITWALDVFTGGIGVFVGLLEGLSELIRIISFTFRLFGNMTAGEILLLMATFLIPLAFALPFYGLELLVGFVQALIFGGLTLVFLTVATAGHERESA